MKSRKTVLTSALVSASLASIGASAKADSERWPSDLVDMAASYDSQILTLKDLETSKDMKALSFGNLFYEQYGVNIESSEPLLVRSDEEASLLQVETIDGLYIEVEFAASSAPLNKL